MARKQTDAQPSKCVYEQLTDGPTEKRPTTYKLKNLKFPSTVLSSGYYLNVKATNESWDHHKERPPNKLTQGKKKTVKAIPQCCISHPYCARFPHH